MKYIAGLESVLQKIVFTLQKSDALMFLCYPLVVIGAIKKLYNILPCRALLTIYVLLGQTKIIVILSITNQTMIHLALIESIQYNAALIITGVLYEEHHKLNL